ncbi:TerB family tellurite resistance protein [Pelagibacteraceae bacterium]|nr:TerB family tellurite resistance protein [Pelagibacteraceae bacterium]
MSIWGRLIGGAAGFALGGPIGAILGVMAGGAFDRRSRSRSSFNFNRIDHNQKQQIFTISFIILSAKLAKSDGQVTDDEISAFKEKFKVPKSELNKVAKIFNEAKKDSYGYKEIANQVGNLFSDNKILLEELLNNLFFIAASDGNISVNEVDLLKSISKSFKFSEKDFQRIFQSNLNNKDSDPYKVLGVNRSSTDVEIRKKWIKLNKEHHPDNLIAKGMPKEFIKQSNKELAAINIAYDKIKEVRGIA